MRDLWRRTAYLFWQKPVLWLPALCAQLVVFYLTQFQQMLDHHIFRWLVSADRAMGIDSLNPPDFATYMKFMLLAAALVWSANYIRICLFAVALTLTASLVCARSKGGQIVRYESFIIVRQNLRGILWFALKFLGLVFAVTHVNNWLSWAVLKAFPAFQATSRTIFVLTLFEVGGVAWMITPASVNLLRNRDAPRLSPEAFRKARIFVVVAVIAISLIDKFLDIVEQPFLTEPLLGNFLIRQVVIATG